jgi:hypothetical protein
MVQGTVEVDFGATPTDTGTFAIVDAAFAGLTYGEAFVMRDSTADASVDEHESFAAYMRFACSISGTTLTIFAELLVGFATGLVKLRYVVN